MAAVQAKTESERGPVFAVKSEPETIDERLLNYEDIDTITEIVESMANSKKKGGQEGRALENGNNKRSRKQQIQRLNMDVLEEFGMVGEDSLESMMGAQSTPASSEGGDLKESSQNGSGSEGKGNGGGNGNKVKLYMLNPDDYPDDPVKQSQIRKAKMTHRHHERKNGELHRLHAENKKLMEILNFFQRQQQIIRKLCTCQNVLRVLGKRGPGVDLSCFEKGDNNNRGNQNARTPIPPNMNGVSVDEVDGMQARPKIKAQRIGNDEINGNAQELEGDSDVKCEVQIQEETPTLHVPLTPPETSPDEKLGSSGATVARQKGSKGPPKLIPKPMLNNSSLTSSKNIPVLKKASSSANDKQSSHQEVLSRAGLTNGQEVAAARTPETPVSKTRNRQKRKAAGPLQEKEYKITPPAKLFQNTVSLINSILEKKQKAGSEGKSKEDQPINLSMKGRVTDEILGNWSGNALPIPVMRPPPSKRSLAAAAAKEKEQSEPFDLTKSDLTTPPRRSTSKRSAATSRLSTKELLGLGTGRPRKSLKGGSPEETKPIVEKEVITTMTDIKNLNDLSKVDWDNFELQYLRPSKFVPLYAKRGSF